MTKWQDMCVEMDEPITLATECDAPVRIVSLEYGQVYKCVDLLGEVCYVGIPGFRAEEADEWDENEYHLWSRDEKKHFHWGKGFMKK